MTALMAHSFGSTNQMIASDTIDDIIIDESKQSEQNNVDCQTIVSNSQPQGIVQRIRGIGHQTYLHYRQTTLWCANQPGYNQINVVPTIREESHTSSSSLAVQTETSSETESPSDSEDNDRTQITSVSINDKKLSLRAKGLKQFS